MKNKLCEIMFVDYRKFSGSLGHNFVGNWFVVLQRQMIHYYVKRSLGRNFVGKGNPRNSRTLIPPAPMNNDDSTVQ